MKKATRFIGFCLLVIFISTFADRDKSINLSDSEKKNVALIVKSNYGYYWGNLKMGAYAAAREFNINIDYAAPGDESDIPGQIELVNKAIDKKVDGIILAASDYKQLVEVTERAYDLRIPIIIIDSEVDTKKVDSYIATDNLEAGRKAGSVIAEISDRKSKVAVMSFLKGSRSAELREYGLLDVISKYPDIEIVAKEYCLSDGKLAYNLTKKIISENEELDAIVALNEVASEGVAQAIDEMDLEGKVKVIAFESTLREIDYLDKGVIQATIIQNPFSMGYLGVKNIFESINNKKIEKRIFIDSKIIDRDNMYLPENEKLLFPLIK
jgi:ribose transport system substrate-binding protein